MLSSLILPAGEGEIDLSVLVCLFYFIFCDYVGKIRVNKGGWWFEVLLTFFRHSEAPTVVCGDPHSPVCYTIMFPANGAAGKKRRLWRDLIAAFQYLKGVYKKDGDKLLSRACCDKTTCNGCKLKEGRFRLDVRKKFFTMRVVKHWNGLPREVVNATSLPGNFQRQVGQGSEQPDLVEEVPAHCKEVELDYLERSLPIQTLL